MSDEKYTLEQVADIVESEGLGYAVMDYMSADKIEDEDLAPELPWALKTASGWNRIWVTAKPSLETPTAVAVSIRGMTGEFTADELEEGIAAMSEVVRRIRAHEAESAAVPTVPVEAPAESSLKPPRYPHGSWAEFGPPAPGISYDEMWTVLSGYVMSAVGNPKPDDAKQIQGFMRELNAERLAPVRAWMESIKTETTEAGAKAVNQ